LDGFLPTGSFIISGTKLFGMAPFGGVNYAGNGGLIFCINTNGSGFKDIFNFDGTNGTLPYGSLILVGYKLYGMTSGGGANKYGCIFSVDTNGSGYKDLYDFPSQGQPWGALTLVGSKLYGMALYGSYGYGNIFSIDTNGSGFSDLKEFEAPFTGEDPYGDLIFVGDKLYGMASGGGTDGDGVVFSYKTNCNIIASISSVTDISCSGKSNGSATVTVTGGTAPFTYLWQPWGQRTLTASNLSAGTYTFQVTDVNSCTSTAIVTITQPSILRDSISTYKCIVNLTSATVGVKGGTLPYTYLWSPGNYTRATENGLANGTYTIKVTDKNGCTATTSHAFKCLAPEKMDDTMNTSPTLTQTDEVSLYPNPNSGQFLISGLTQGMRIECYNILGQIIYSSTTGNEGEQEFNISQQPNGIYLVRIMSKDGSFVTQKKVVKIR
jgi:uncharacterized repeat protein (TIGR03803 family)